MCEIEDLIGNIRLAREAKQDYTIPFNISHIVLGALLDKQERDNAICFNCKYLTLLERNADLNGQYWHCALSRGEETKNVWHKYSKHYQDYSLVAHSDFCSYFEAEEDNADV